MVCIKGLDKAHILYVLWKQARVVPWLKNTEFVPECSLAQCQEDIGFMTASGDLDILFYYGKIIKVDLTTDEIKVKYYNKLTKRPGLAEKLIEKIRKKTKSRIKIKKETNRSNKRGLSVNDKRNDDKIEKVLFRNNLDKEIKKHTKFIKKIISKDSMDEVDIKEDNSLGISRYGKYYNKWKMICQ